MRRDFAYRSTLDLFFQAGRRGSEERKWHTQFCNSRMCSDRIELLRCCRVLQAFVVDGVALRAGDVVEVTLCDGVVLKPLTVGPGSLAGQAAGVRPDD